LDSSRNAIWQSSTGEHSLKAVVFAPPSSPAHFFYQTLSHVGQSLVARSLLALLAFDSLKPKTEQFLYLLLWSADQLTRPTFRNLNESFEGWAYRNGLLRQIAALEKRRFIERKGGSADDRNYRLTAEGRLWALSGCDPQARWSRAWDGRWRLVLFDVPIARNTERSRLRRYLRNRHFGCLQGSVWITPDPLTEETRLLGSAKTDVNSLIFLEARPCAHERDAEIVTGGWNFDRINRLYRQHLKLLREKPRGKLNSKRRVTALHQWAEAERLGWRGAVKFDPFLPRRLLPPGYLGERVWQRRIEALGDANRALQTFSL
jgi:DNA-binding transcriptional regulator PaaX